jgi:hypothetical protein
MQVIVLLVLLLAVVGIALGLAITNIRLRRECVEADRAGLLWHRRFDEERDRRLALETLVQHYGAALIDGHGRWGFAIAPEMRKLIGHLTSEQVSAWLVQNAGGNRRLSDGGRASWWSSAIPEDTGWEPPRLVVARLNGEEGS